MPLLLHSLFEFWPTIKKLLDISQARSIVEIGAEFATTTQALCDWANTKGECSIISIDTQPSEGLLNLQKKFPQLKVFTDSSLVVLPELSAQDFYLIDGDHNYYTVSAELKKIHDASVVADHPVVMVLHDVGWPCARRDQYYDPLKIPSEFRYPFSYKLGITIDNPSMIDGGFRGEGAFAYAEREGGPRNGVLTAIDDFLQENNTYSFYKIDAVFGLGILISRNHPAANDIKECLTSLTDNYLISTLERNRLELFLQVVALQDEINSLKKPSRLSQ